MDEGFYLCVRVRLLVGVWVVVIVGVGGWGGGTFSKS